MTCILPFLNTLDLRTPLTVGESSKVFERENLQGSSKVSFLLLGLDEPGQLGAGLVHVDGRFVGVAVGKSTVLVLCS